MKKQTLLVILLTGLMYGGFATQVTQQKAQTIAINFFKATYPAPLCHTNFTAVLKYTSAETGNPADFYVFDIQPAYGFVIVAGNDIITPVLAYSNEGYFNSNFHHQAIESWLDKTARNIRKAVNQHINAEPKVTAQWNAYIQGTNPATIKSGVVAPLLTTTWDQESGSNPPPYLYNLYCPYNNTDQQRSLTGCVATAQAQIMKFWNYPAMGVDSFSYTDNTANGYSNNYGTLSSNFAAHTYRWQLMPDILDGTEHGPQDTAVDLLMYDCAVSVGMDFGDDNEGGSGANGLLQEELMSYGDSISSQYALIKYFDYDPDTIRGIFKADFSDSAWINIIEHDLDMGRPILYEGNDTTQGGHAWVCDGYDTHDKLHMNWGWSGADNGYFAIDNLTTSGNFNPILEDDALIGILPKHTVSTGTKQVAETIHFNIYPNPASNQLIIQTANSSPATISLIDILGQTAIAKDVTEQKTILDVSALSAGIYLVRIQQGEQMAIKQLVITK